MALFKEHYCALCGEKVKGILKTKLGDDNYICSKCNEETPSEINLGLSKYNLDEYKEMKEYLKYSEEVLKPKFKETHKYHSLHLDADNGLFYYTDFFVDSVIIEVENIEEFDLEFIAEKYKEGMFNIKVYGDVMLGLTVSKPYFATELKVAKHVKTKGEKKLFNKKIQYTNPDEVTEFYIALLESKQRIEELKQESSVSEAKELQQALALFMLDDMNELTIDELEDQKNTMINMYQSNNDSPNEKFIKKINRAFEIIKNEKEKGE